MELVAMLPVHNEAGRYLPRVLDQLSQLADLIVVYDDASTDATPALLGRYPRVRAFRGRQPWFPRHEAQLRHHLWRLTVRFRPRWILALDADELFEERALAELPPLLAGRDYDAVAFRLFDFWKGEEQVRVDGAWNPWNRFSPLLVRYRPELPDTWPDQVIHCGRLPLAYRELVTFQSHLRVRHYGWARGGEHLAKYLFYRERDLAQYGRVSAHTESVLAPRVTLEPWIPLEPAPFFRSRRQPERR
ncbi:MAG: glycosyltransferase family 2 protein [Firmicutes bacterium]|nr:glycosyltransferase family 2 protein [Bacillota bacterium]